ncbi:MULTISPECIES: PA0061/PA0062 family lipoprotein [Pseudomonadaceae]|nr:MULTISPECIES: hypothetical protein [Pseudomonas]MDC7825960.1 hypothetical protein [Pseudomonas sp. BLCC-B13]
MRTPLLLSLLALGACASPLPQPDAGKAWVDLYATAGYTLMAHRLDDQRWPDGRYFQVAPGAHQLDVRFQFEVAGGGGGDEFNGEPLQMTCHLRFAYDGFAAGQRYRIEARPLQYKAQGWLYGADRQVLARAKVLRCNTFG